MNPYALLAAIVGFATASPVVLQRQTKCNGTPDLCDRKYSNVSYIGTHDSAFVGSIYDPSVNQEMSVTAQLDAGIRFMSAQTHKNAEGVLSMCHTSCFLEDAGSLNSYLTTVKNWLDANPDALLTVLLTNGDYLNVTEFAAVFEATGLKDYAFVPSTSPNPLTIDDWPTYGEMISSGKRLVAFIDYDGDESEVPYILEEWHYFLETPYDTTDPTFPECSINRPPGASADGRMVIMNHFLDKDYLGVDVPDNSADSQTNAPTGTGSIGAQAEICQKNFGRPPNFVLVDMFNRGDVFAWQHSMNQ